jgi:septum formation topological specificity factor MinE
MFHIRSIKRKLTEKLRQKVDAMSEDALKWHSKYVNSENELAVRMKDAEREKDHLSRETSKWHKKYLDSENELAVLMKDAEREKDNLSRETLKWHKKYLDSENEMAVRLRNAEIENAYLCQVLTETSAIVIHDKVNQFDKNSSSAQYFKDVLLRIAENSQERCGQREGRKSSKRRGSKRRGSRRQESGFERA